MDKVSELEKFKEFSSSVEEEKLCILGIDDVDSNLGPFPCRGLILVLGHPGGGKTTLVSQLVYANAKKLGRKALFITFYETRETLFRNLKNVGIDLEKLEHLGLVKVIPMLTVSSSEAADYLVSMLGEAMTTFNPDIIVIDGISAFLESLSSPHARAFLHSILYRIAHTNHKLIVVVADLPWGKESVHLGGMEFVADAVLLVKTRIEHRRLVRFLEIRKFRGKQTPIAEIPFAIVPELGIRVLIPLKMAFYGVKSGELDLSVICRDSESLSFGTTVSKGTQILVLHQPGSEIPRIAIAALAKVALLNRIKMVVITYGEPIEGIEQTLEVLYRNLGMSKEEASKYIKIYGINLAELWAHGSRLMEFNLIESEGPHLAVLAGLRTAYEIIGNTDFVTSQLNDVLKYKSMGITVVRLHAYTGKEYVPTMDYSDVVIRASIEFDDDKPKLVLDILKSAKPLELLPRRRVVDLEKFLRCLLTP